MIEILPKIPQYLLARAVEHYHPLPMSLTISLLYTCNSRCKTCNVWKKTAKNFSVDEYEKTFRSLGTAPYWFTMSGGEPFLRPDIAEICQLAHDICRPGIINIPTNGSLTERIGENLPKLLKKCPNSKVVVNLSLDQVGEKHDEIRGIPHNFEKSMRTLEILKALRAEYRNFTVGIHTVVSNFNVDQIAEIYDALIHLGADSYITEIAEERVELGTMGAGITPPLDKYTKAIDFLSDRIREQHFSGIGRITRAFRLNYYKMVKQVLKEKRQIIPCYAGIASAQISPDGDVWPCCIRAESMGNLREAGYDFKKIWNSPAANAMRKSIKDKECYCPLANASYTNMLMDMPTMCKVGIKFLLGK